MTITNAMLGKLLEVTNPRNVCDKLRYDKNLTGLVRNWIWLRKMSAIPLKSVSSFLATPLVQAPLPFFYLSELYALPK